MELIGIQRRPRTGPRDRDRARRRRSAWRRCSSTSATTATSTTGATGDDPVRLAVRDLRARRSRWCSCSPRSRVGADRVALPAAAAQLGQPGAGGGSRHPGAAGRRAATCWRWRSRSRSRAITIGAILSTALLVGPAATALRLTGVPAGRCWPRRLIGVVAIVARDPARLRQLLLAAAGSRLAGQLLRRHAGPALLSAIGLPAAEPQSSGTRPRAVQLSGRSDVSAASWSTPGSSARSSRSSPAPSASSSSCAARRSSPTRSPTARSRAPPGPA